MDIAVIGGGVFGTLVAIRLAEAGHKVTIFERLPVLMQGTSQNANRLHLGFHYPRDNETVRQCGLGYARFKAEFGEAVLPGVANAYFIASEGSLVSPEAFLAFCDSHGLPYREIDHAAFRPGISNVDLGIVTEEIMYDPVILHRLVMTRLERLGVAIRIGAAVDGIGRTTDDRFLLSAGAEERPFDAVVNCTYANVNRVSGYLGHQATRRQYEYTVSPVIEFPDRSIPSITILDGPFFGLLPLNTSGDILLFHVVHSVVAREDRDYVDPAWLDPATAPFASIDKAPWLRAIMEEATGFIPELRNARVKGVREGPRMVLANVDDTDTRPSMVRLLEPGYVEVFSGKIVHSAWVGGEVERLLESGAGSPS